MKNKKVTQVIDGTALWMFLLCIGAFLVGYGVMVERYRLFPYKWIVTAETGLLSVAKPKTKPHHLNPARYDFNGVKFHNVGAIADGLTLLTGFWRDIDWKPGVRLIDLEGNVLHSWNADPAEIWPESPHSDFIKGTKNSSGNYVHGTHLFENGDLLFNIEYLGLVRMNAQCEVIWKLPYRTHHSINRDESENFWVCGMKWIEDNPQGRERLALYPGLQAPVVEDYALLVSPEGKILREISIVKVIYDSGFHKQIWQNRFKEDILHVNDVEPLPSDIADQYPLFNANDLLVSCREIGAILVIDIETEKVKWFSREFLMQHDPDFIGDGYIQVFDNNTDGSNDGRYAGGSEIVYIKPGSDQLCVRYPTDNTQKFYTSAGGKAQELGNGNLLISEARAGRIFEIDQTGKTVWEWVAERYDELNVPEVLEGTRYSITPKQVAAWRSENF